MIYRVLPIFQEFYNILASLTVLCRGLPSRPKLKYRWFRPSDELNARININNYVFFGELENNNTKQHNK